MRNMSPPPHKQDNGMDPTHKAMSQRIYRDNDHERETSKASPARDTAARKDDGAARQPELAAGGRFGAHHYSGDQDRRGFERSYQREHNHTGRHQRSDD